jgi:hypothetical protein
MTTTRGMKRTKSTKAATTMTESIPGHPAPNAEQLDRVAALRARRQEAAAAAPGGASTGRSKRRRRHVAQGSRILAAGLGATTMFGIVTVLGLDNPASGADESITRTVPAAPAASSSTAVPQVQIVIHRVPASSVPSSGVVAAEAEGAAALAESILTAPVQLTANPVVQTITVAAPGQPRSSSQASSSPAPAPAPAATTSGSS